MLWIQRFLFAFPVVFKAYFVYHRIRSLTQTVEAMLWSMAQLRRGQLRKPPPEAGLFKVMPGEATSVTCDAPLLSRHHGMQPYIMFVLAVAAPMWDFFVSFVCGRPLLALHHAYRVSCGAVAKANTRLSRE